MGWVIFNGAEHDHDPSMRSTEWYIPLRIADRDVRTHTYDEMEQELDRVLALARADILAKITDPIDGRTTPCMVGFAEELAAAIGRA